MLGLQNEAILFSLHIILLQIGFCGAWGDRIRNPDGSVAIGAVKRAGVVSGLIFFFVGFVFGIAAITLMDYLLDRRKAKQKLKEINTQTQKDKASSVSRPSGSTPAMTPATQRENTRTTKTARSAHVEKDSLKFAVFKKKDSKSKS
uniref:MARVEL domain-containing protein n=1 Tax=Panagrellus redivivus TaxID=6233 RepID=A0A7E4ZUX0_PANRE